MDRIVEIQKLNLEDNAEQSLRPLSFDEYIGQEKIKSNLAISLQAAKKRAECLDHTLFYGPPGLGKTTLAHIIAHSMGANIKVSAAPMIEKSGDLAAILTNLEEGDVLFIDEIHRLSPAIEEILYSAMEDFRLDIIIGQGPAAQTIKVDIAHFTLVGATTRAGNISAPLRDRFGLAFRLQFYTNDELAKIISAAAIKLNKICDDEAGLEIAKRSRGTPRIALRLLRRIRDYADVAGENHINKKRAQSSLKALGVSDLGLDEMDLRYLALLANSGGKALGLGTIAAALSEDEHTIEDVLEPFLLSNGYIQRTAKGRVLSAKGYEICGIRDENPLFDF